LPLLNQRPFRPPDPTKRMRLISLLIRIAIFVFVLVFALANTHVVTLTLIPGISGLTLEAPMVLWLLGIFSLGVFACFLLLLPTLMRAWRRPADPDGN